MAQPCVWFFCRIFPQKRTGGKSLWLNLNKMMLLAVKLKVCPIPYSVGLCVGSGNGAPTVAGLFSYALLKLQTPQRTSTVRLIMKTPVPRSVFTPSLATDTIKIALFS
jgi:hypothetical protein